VQSILGDNLGKYHTVEKCKENNFSTIYEYHCKH